MISSNIVQDKASDRILDALCKHIVCLSWLDVLVSPNEKSDKPSSYEPEAFAVSSFIITVKDIWFLVTAGHILKKLEKRLKAGRKIVKSRLIDGMAGATGIGSIIFDLGNEPQWYIDDDNGLDYGVIPLRPLYVQQLIAAGIKPLVSECWIDIPSDPDACFLLGFPKEEKKIDLRIFEDGGDVRIEIGTPLLPVEPIDNPPERIQKSADRFYAKVPIITAAESSLDKDFTDIDGMSGGPLFVIKQTGKGKSRYWIVGIQSSWLPDERILAACPIQPLADSIINCIEKNGYLEDGHMPD